MACCRATSGAATCCARSCGARCGTASGWGSTRAVPSRPGRRVVAQMGDAYPELRRAATRSSRSIRDEEQRFDAVLSASACRSSKNCSIAPRRRAPRAWRRGVQAVRHASACRSTSSRTWRASGSWRFDRAGFDRAMEGQREKARAKSAFDGKKAEEFAFAIARVGRASASAGRSLRGLHDDDRRRRDGCWRSSTTEAQQVARAASRSHPATSRWTARRSISSPAARCPMSATFRTRPAPCIARVDGRRAPRRGAAPRAPGARSPAGRSATASSRPPWSTRRPATRRAGTTRRRTCCTPRCARCSART